MYTVVCRIFHMSGPETLAEAQRSAAKNFSGKECHIELDGVEVARWAPGTGWRYYRSAEQIAEWFSNNWSQEFSKLRSENGCLPVYHKDIAEQTRQLQTNYHYYAAANAYLDAHGLLLPEGALPAGLPKVELRTPKDIAAWCRDHFDNQDVRTAIVKARLNIATPRHWVDDAWKDCYANDSTKRIHFNLVRDLHQYPELHRRLSEIIDGYQPEQAPVDVTHGWSPRTIAEWYEHNNGGSGFSFQLWANEQKGRRWHNVWIGKYTLVTWLEDHFHAAAAWLESHGIQAPVQAPGRSAEEIIAWLKGGVGGYRGSCEIGYRVWNEFDDMTRSHSHRKVGYTSGHADELYAMLRTNPSYLQAVNDLLDKHGINIERTDTMATQKSPIFGIKLACGSQIGFQKMADGRVLFRLSGASLDLQTVSADERRKLYQAGEQAYNWTPAEPADEWRF